MLYCQADALVSVSCIRRRPPVLLRKVQRPFCSVETCFLKNVERGDGGKSYVSFEYVAGERSYVLFLLGQ